MANPVFNKGKFDLQESEECKWKRSTIPLKRRIIEVVADEMLDRIKKTLGIDDKSASLRAIKADIIGTLLDIGA